MLRAWFLWLGPRSSQDRGGHRQSGHAVAVEICRALPSLDVPLVLPLEPPPVHLWHLKYFRDTSPLWREPSSGGLREGH